LFTKVMQRSHAQVDPYHVMTEIAQPLHIEGSATQRHENRLTRQCAAVRPVPDQVRVDIFLLPSGLVSFRPRLMPEIMFHKGFPFPAAITCVRKCAFNSLAIRQKRYSDLLCAAQSASLVQWRNTYVIFCGTGCLIATTILRCVKRT